MNENRIKDLLSVIVFTYNQKGYIKGTIDSIIVQDYEYVELIVVDDGTKDFDCESLINYINENKRNNIVHVSCTTVDINQGTVKNLNRGLELSNGEFIKVIGGDDTFYSSSTFSKQIEQIKNKDNCLACAGLVNQCDIKMNHIYDERTEKSNASIPIVLKMNSDRAKKYIMDEFIFPFASQAMCFVADFFVRGGKCSEDYVLIEDSPLMIRLLSNIDRVTYLDEYVVNHRNDSGVSTSKIITKAKRLYYHDELTFLKNEIMANPEIYGSDLKKRFSNRSLALYYEKMSVDKRNTIRRLIVYFKYMDIVFVSIIKTPKKIFNHLLKRNC